MKNKLINIKNLLRIVISLMIIVSIAKSCSKAYTWNEFTEFLETYKDSYNEANMCTAINYALNHIEEVEAKYINAGYNLNNYKTFYCVAYKLDYTYTAIFYAYEFDDVDWSCLQNNTIQFNTTNKYEVMVRFNYGSRYNPSSMSIENPNRQLRSSGSLSHLTGLFNTEARNGVYYDTTYVNQYYDTTNIYFGHLFSSTITYNSEEMEANELDYNYRIEFVENVITEDNEITSMQATLDNLNLECQDLGSYWTLKCNNSTLLKYNQIYTLNVTAIVNGNEEEIEEKIIFIPPGTTIIGGVITFIPSGDYNFNTENATNQIIDNINNLNNTIESGNKEFINNINDSSEVDNIMSETLSGDINTISSDLGFSALDNPFTSFLFFVIEGVYDVLTEREDIVLSTHYKSLEFNLASTDFIIPQNELKTFIRNMLVCVYIYGNYKYFHYMITLLETARINKFMAEIGTDEFYDTDIM